MQDHQYLSEEVQDSVDQVAHSKLGQAVTESIRDGASQLVDRGATALKESTARARDAAGRVAEATVDYARERPLQALLIAAATGALVAVIANLALRRHDRH